MASEGAPAPPPATDAGETGAAEPEDSKWGKGVRKTKDADLVWTATTKAAVTTATVVGTGARKASVMMQNAVRKDKVDLSTIVIQARVTHRAKESFTRLTEPRRPPFPGTATPPGYVIHRRRPPADASGPEKFRDVLLDIGTHKWVAVLQLGWLLALVAIFVVFIGCMMYWFDWGYVTVEDWGCTRNTSDPNDVYNNPKTTCDPPALTYSVEDYWQEKMTQGLSALFTYSVLLASPWRVSILVQCFGRRCKGKTSGVDFYGKPNEMPFFHIPWGPRLAIAILLNINTVMQLIHQVLHVVWADVVVYFEQPEGLISLATGPVAGCLTGGPAAVIQVYWDNVLHAREPGRFPPGLVQAVRAKFGAGQLAEEEKSKGSKAATQKASCATVTEETTEQEMAATRAAVARGARDEEKI
eukprot:Transcript_7633.p2 GENE.Transcript_7633~~Transcript_7633.p2  ORF type:complete len:413 (+),score=148.40 Transcript_7633:152-1390(+)